MLTKLSRRVTDLQQGIRSILPQPGGRRARRAARRGVLRRGQVGCGLERLEPRCMLSAVSGLDLAASAAVEVPDDLAGLPGGCVVVPVQIDNAEGVAHLGPGPTNCEVQLLTL